MLTRQDLGSRPERQCRADGECEAREADVLVRIVVAKRTNETDPRPASTLSHLHVHTGFVVSA